MPRRTWYKQLSAPFQGVITRPATVPPEAYTVRHSGVTLTGGQALGAIPGYPTTSGTVTSPAVTETIVSVTVPPGTYTVQWTVTLAGTINGNNTNNFGLYNGSSFVAESVNADAAGSYPQTARTLTVTAAQPTISIYAGGTTPGTGSIYTAILTSASASLTLQTGPQGLGTVWYPAQVTTATTSGVNDTSTCLVYMGAAGTPTTLMGTLYPGGAGVLAVAFPPLTVGLFVIAVFTGGRNADIASVNVTGTMDYLDTT